MSEFLPLKAKEEVRDVTFNPSTFVKAFKISSVIPSLKYSLSGSLLMFTNGKTAMLFFSSKPVFEFSCCIVGILRPSLDKA